ncbi:hypothetical protein MUS1_08960 [Marinomonas ushuaiensis DSM 15871]|uniref:Uncharacterized protein n=1 Tax=Marinomonas ushuaiensis DSM 15871 TaxID=1122207 RepID=X7E0G0_9GAMM|nr:hypothetical protein MUS1_08960 [Marinomonas ushuaiensis DSM 15871]
MVNVCTDNFMAGFGVIFLMGDRMNSGLLHGTCLSMCCSESKGCI